MHQSDTGSDLSSQTTHSKSLVPVEQLILEVYATAHVSVRSRILSRLVGRVYESAPPAIRRKLLEHLLRPLGLLSIAAVANGAFAKVLSRGNWLDKSVPLDEVQNIQSGDVVTLVDYVLQVSGDAINGLAHLLTASPTLTSSAAATVLVTLLLQRASKRRSSDVNTD